MIPQKIHYIWLGKNKKSNLINICINSWKSILLNYEIIEWNEYNLDLDKISKENRFFHECRKRKLWAFMADYLRLYILLKEGGIYFDTDIQVLKNIDPLLNEKCFLGLEANNNYGTGVIGAEPNNIVIKNLLDFYKDEIWRFDVFTIPLVFNKVFLNKPELLNHIKIYPMEYFAPYDYTKEFNHNMLTTNTYTIHWFDANWSDKLPVRTFLRVKHIKNPIIKRILICMHICKYLIRKIVK